MSELEQALHSYDGRAVSVLSEIRAKFAQNEGFYAQLISLIDSPEGFISDGTTWLIKECVETGAELNEQHVANLVQRLDGISTWPAVLHLCQSARHIDFSSKQAIEFGRWAYNFVSHERPFVRAWSMDALQHVAQSAPPLMPLAGAALSAALEDPAASVRARAKCHVKSDHN